MVSNIPPGTENDNSSNENTSTSNRIGKTKDDTSKVLEEYNIGYLKRNQSELLLGLVDPYTNNDIEKSFDKLIDSDHFAKSNNNYLFGCLNNARNYLLGSYDGDIIKGWYETKFELMGRDEIEVCDFKDGIYEGKDYKIEKGKHKSYITKDRTINTVRYALRFVGNKLEGKDWALLSSGSMFIRKQEYKRLPGDIDIAMTMRDFVKIKDELLFEKEDGFRFSSIFEPDIDLTNNKEEIQRLLKLGHLRMDFNIFVDGVGVNVELFPELPGIGLVQLGHMTKIEELILILTGDLDYLNGLPDGVLAQSYFANLIIEIIKDTIIDEKNDKDKGKKKASKKIKASIRMNNILQYLTETGIKDIDGIIAGMQQAVDKYVEEGSRRIGKNKELLGYLEGAKDGLNSALEFLNEMKKEYKSWIIINKERGVLTKGQKNSEGIKNEDIKLGNLPNFYLFMSETKEIRKGLEIINSKIKESGNLDELEKNYLIRIKYLSRIDELSLYNMRDPKSIVYFSEIYIIKKHYLKEIEKNYLQKKLNLPN